MHATPTTIALLATALLSGCLTDLLAQECRTDGPTNFTGEELRVLDQGAFDWMFPVIQPRFENQTGAHLVQVKGEDAGGALRLAIDSLGNPVADVIYGVDNVLFFEAARAGVLHPYTSPNLDRLVLPAKRLDDFRYLGEVLATPADQGFISVNYDRRLADEVPSEELPEDLRDLATPRWAPEFVVQDPRLSSPGLGFLVITVATFGENNAYDYLDYWRDLFRNGVLVSPDWPDAYVVHFSAGYGQYEEGFVGDRRIVVSYTTSPAVEALFLATEPPSVSLEPPRGVFEQVETVAILQCTHQLPLAQAFVDFVLSDAFQNEVPANLAVYPVTGAPLPDAFTDHATSPEDLVPAPYSSRALESGVPRWLRAWTELYEAEAA